MCTIDRVMFVVITNNKAVLFDFFYNIMSFSENYFKYPLRLTYIVIELITYTHSIYQ